MEQQRPISGYS